MSSSRTVSRTDVEEPRRKARSASARTVERLLLATAAVIKREGASAVTLDAVAAEAGSSKGGLLYHFPTKEALLDALVDWWHDDFQRRLEATQSDTHAASFLLAMDRHTTAPDWRHALEHGPMAVLAGAPEQAARVRGRYEAWQKWVTEDAADPVAATIVRLAADGLWLTTLYDLAPPDPDLRRAVLERLMEMARGDALSNSSSRESNTTS
jgi:AcrR family transcriptional regulator